MEKESKEEKLPEKTEVIEEIKEDLKEEIKVLDEVKEKVTKEIQTHKRRGTAPPLFLNKIKDLIEKENTVTNYLQ